MKPKQTVPPAQIGCVTLLCLIALFAVNRAINPPRASNSAGAPTSGAAFETFRAGNTSDLVSSWRESMPGHAQGNVGPGWNRLSQSDKARAVSLLWQIWSQTNSPSNPRNSTLTLFQNGADVGHARFDLRGQWEITAQ